MTKFYGSVVNRIMESSRYPEITVGMGATICHWSDRSPATVVAIRYTKTGAVHEIDIVGDETGPNLETWPSQRYEITPTDPATVDPAHVQTWRMDRRGRLRKTMINENGRRVLTDNGGIVLGSRDYYQDPSF